MKTIDHKIWILMAMLCASLSSFAYDFEVDGIYYNVVSLEDMTCKVVNNGKKNTYGNPIDPYSGDIVIPEEVNYNNHKLTVIAIEKEAFSKSQITSMVMPNSITEIGENAFYECKYLKHLTISNSVHIIGPFTFADCKSLEDLIIPDSVTEIGRYAFRNCESLNSVIIGDAVTIIGNDAFSNCSAMINLTIGTSVTDISIDAFRNCKSLKSLIIPNSVKKIGTEAFLGCRNLESVVIGDSLGWIKKSTFEDCTSLNSVTMGESIKTIDDSAFKGCSSLTSIEIPNSVTEIGEMVFADCVSLESIQLSNSLKYITNGTFLNCKKLEEIEIPGSVETINLYYQGYNGAINKTFGGCDNLKKVSLSFSSTPLIIINSKYNDVPQNNPSWPESVKELYIDRPLRDKIKIPNLEKLVIGESVECVKLHEYSLTLLNTIVSYALVPPELPEMSNDKYININVFVPETALEAYKADPVWGKFWNIEGFDPNSVVAETISLNIESAELNIGEVFQLEASVLPEDTTDKTIEWTSSNEEVATVDEAGLVTAISEGSATITATCGEVRASCVIIVTPILAETLTISPESWTGEEGESFFIETTVLPENTSDKTLKFESDDEGVAVVDQNGKVSVLKEGICVITVSTVDGSELSAQCFITGLAGIESIFSDADMNVDIYTQGGVLLKSKCSLEDLKQLPPAVYIIRTDTNAKKVIISHK